MSTISRERYEAAIEAGFKKWASSIGNLRDGLKATLAAAGVEVEKTAEEELAVRLKGLEERDAAFLAKFREWKSSSDDYGILYKIIQTCFPEARDG